jgi:thioesterase domain-containing protein/acyl carrier protein
MRGSVAPRTPVEAALARIWSEVLGLEKVGVRDNFFHLGGHSLLALKIVAAIERQFGAKLSPAVLFAAATIEQLAARIQSQHAVEAGLSAVAQTAIPVNPDGALPVLFLAHDVSGQVLSYYPLAARLGKRRATYALEARGAHGTLSAMAEDYASAIRSVQPVGPYLLGGHSFGATVAFETASRLEQMGETVACLLVFDADAPQAGESYPHIPGDEAGLLVYAVRTLAVFFEREIPIERTELDPLDEQGRLALVLARLRESEVLPDETTTGQLAGMLRVYQANLACLKSYQPGSIRAPIHVWSACEAPGAPAYRGWDKLTSAPVTAWKAAGDHVSMLKDPSVAALADQTAMVLERSLEEENRR